MIRALQIRAFALAITLFSLFAPNLLSKESERPSRSVDSSIPVLSAPTQAASRRGSPPNAELYRHAEVPAATPPYAERPTNPSSQFGRSVTMLSPKPGDTFQGPAASLRLVAQAWDPTVASIVSLDGTGRSASRVEFFVDDRRILTVGGNDSELGTFKTRVIDVPLEIAVSFDHVGVLDEHHRSVEPVITDS